MIVRDYVHYWQKTPLALVLLDSSSTLFPGIATERFYLHFMWVWFNPALSFRLFPFFLWPLLNRLQVNPCYSSTIPPSGLFPLPFLHQILRVSVWPVPTSIYNSPPLFSLFSFEATMTSEHLSEVKVPFYVFCFDICLQLLPSNI